MDKNNRQIDGIASKQKPEAAIALQNIWPVPKAFGRRAKKRNGSIFLLGCLVMLMAASGLRLISYGQHAKKEILGSATAAMDLLEQGQNDLLSQNFNGAEDKFQLASKTFEDAKSQIFSSNIFLSDITSRLPVGKDVDALLNAGNHISRALLFLSAGADVMQGMQFAWNSSENSLSPEFYESLKTSHLDFVDAQGEVDESLALLKNVNSGIIPQEYQARFSDAFAKLNEVDSLLGKLTSVQGFLLGLLGGENKTFILVFQNNNEARAAGGFIGTYGILHFENGQMKIERIESIYALDGQLKEQIAAPGALQRQETPLWGMRDSNWFVDFPASGRKIISFFEKESGTLADGVISFTPDTFEKLLEVTGPVQMPEYGETLDAQNFRSVVQYKTSIDYDKQLNQPKKFLADFVPRFLDKLEMLDAAQRFKVINIFADMVAQKQIIMFSLDQSMQNYIQELGAGGEIKATDGDYLAIFNSNVGGGKTDQNILQSVETLVTVGTDNRTVVNLKITRTHQGFDEKYFPKNLDYMRVLVPKGSKLLGTSGFDDAVLLPSVKDGANTDSDLAAMDSARTRDEQNKIYVGEEANYTEFSNWLELIPGETKTVEISYLLPDRINLLNGADNYTLLVQKQPGAKAFDFELKADFQNRGKQFDQKETVSTDRFYSITAE